MCPDAFVVHTSGTGQLRVNPPVVGPRLSPGKSTRIVVTMMGSDGLVVGEDHMVEPQLPVVYLANGLVRLDGLWQFT